MATTDTIQGVPPGAIATPIQGVPPGAIATPIQGVPPGATATPITPPAAPAAPPAAPADDSGGIGDYIGPKALMHFATGAERGVAKTVIGAKDIAGKVINTGPESHYFQGMRQFANAPNAGLMESAGEAGENMGEYLTGEGLLKLVSPALKGAEALKAAAKIGEVLEAHPVLAKAVSAGLKAAGLTGLQTYAKTGGDAGAAVVEGAVGGVTGGVLAGTGEGVSRLVSKIRPVAGKIGDEEVTYLASQRPGGSTVGGATTANTPAIAREQQAAGGRVIRNVARRATEESIERLNATRPEAPTISNPARLLTSGEGALPQGAAGPQPKTQPFTFHIEGTPTYEGNPPAPTSARQTYTHDNAIPGALQADVFGEGSAPARRSTIFYPARAEQIGTREATAGERAAVANIPPFQQVPIMQYLTDIHPGSEPIPLDMGGGQLRTTDPQVAQTTLSRLNELVESGHVPPEHKAAITAARDSLQEQMDMYHAYDDEGRNISGAHFPKIDPKYASKNVETFRDSADQTRMPATPVYQKLDELSGGDFSKWNDQRKRAGDVLRNPDRAPINESTHRQAKADLKEANDEINTIFAEHRDRIKPRDWQAASNAWRDASTLDDLHNVTEGAFNRSDAARDQAKRLGRDRTLRGNQFTENLNDLTSTPAKHANVIRVIGQDGLDNLYDVADMLKTPESAAAVKGVANNVGMFLVHRGGTAATVGAVAGYTMGGPAGAAIGGLTGASSEVAARYVMRRMATDPKIAKMVKYAADYGARPENYAPLIGAMIQGVSDNKPAEKKPQ